MILLGLVLEEDVGHLLGAILIIGQVHGGERDKGIWPEKWSTTWMGSRYFSC